MKLLINKNLVGLMFLFITLVGLTSVFSGRANAQAAPINLSSIGECGSSSNQFNDLLKQLPSNGMLYLKLNNTTETSSPTDVYIQTFSDSQCHLIGVSNPVYGSWVKVGYYNLNTSAGASIVVAGSGLGALPYQAVASVLVLPNPPVCVPVVNCQVNYDGFRGILSPQIITGATDEVAVYVANPFDSVGYSKVNYYSNDQFLYDSSVLKPINRNYLDGGVHQVSIEVDLNDQQTLTINQTINRGTDFTGTLYIKSLIYRSQNKALVFIIPAMILIILLLLLWIVRLIYKHRRYKIEHGLHGLPKNYGVEYPDEHDEDIFIG